jgi:hypothetical protein
MMSLLGPDSEGSLPTRTFFEIRTLGSLVSLVSSQYPWVVILGITVSAYILSRTRFSTVTMPRYLGVTLSWPLGVYRLMVGPSSNVSAILLTYGPVATNGGYFVVFVGAGTLAIIDFVRTLNRSQS